MNSITVCINPESTDLIQPRLKQRFITTERLWLHLRVS